MQGLFVLIVIYFCLISYRKAAYSKDPADVNLENKTFQQSQTSRQLQCIIDGNPAVFTFDKWQHKSVYGVLIRELEGNSVLILPSVPEDKRYQDTGEYSCTASNGILNNDGEVKQSGHGFVISSALKQKNVLRNLSGLRPSALPVFTPDNKHMQYGETGKSANIHVNVYSVPKYTTQTWYKDNLTISKSSKFAVTDTPILVYDVFHTTAVTLDGYRVTLSIDNLQEEDFTSYMVELSNGIGQSANYTVILAAHTDNHRSSSSGPLIGGVVGGFVVIVVIFSTVLLVFFKTRRGKSFPENQSSEKQYDNIGMDISLDDYEEVQNKGHQDQSKGNETISEEHYTSLGMKDQQNVYDELKKK